MEKKKLIEVVEIEEREVVSATLVSTKEEGIKLANKMLRDRIQTCDPEDYGYANEENCCAWCNDSDNWDAHIIDYLD